jgi:AcrR family transcriptional regulator
MRQVCLSVKERKAATMSIPPLPQLEMPGQAAQAGAAKSARQRILDTAIALFYRDGIRAVGIDTIIAQSGVAKMSLYRHFASKDDLVVAYLDWRDRTYWDWWDKVLAQHPGDAPAQLRALFASILERITNPAYRGCAFLNTATEFPRQADGSEHPGRAVAVAHKAKARARLAELATALGARQPQLLADQLLVLLDGIYSTAPLFGPGWDAACVFTALDALVAAQCDGKRDR